MVVRLLKYWNIMKNTQKPKTGDLRPWHYICSILGAFIGVQSKRIFEQDNQQSDPFPYIVGGVIFTIFFIASILFFVHIAVT